MAIDLQVSESSTRNAYVDLVALGENVLSTVNPDYVSSFYASSSETSFAAPQVSAAAALLKEQHPSWSADQVENWLISTAVDLGDAGRDDLYGYGLLDAATAVGYQSSSSGGSSAGSGEGSGSASPNTGNSVADIYKRYLDEFDEAA